MASTSRRSTTSDSGLALLGALAFAAWILAGRLDGALSPLYWGPVGTAVLLLLAIALATVPIAAERWERSRLAMLAALGAFVAWSFLSILWADFPADAWNGSDKSLLYGATFALFALWPSGKRTVDLALGLVALGIAALGAVVLVDAVLAADPAGSFQDHRLLEPTGYVNANVALWMTGFWPAVHLGSSRRVPPPLRALVLAAAAFLLDLAVLGESRGWLFLLAPALLLFLLLARQRLRSLLGLALVAGSSLAVLRPLLDVYDRSVAGTPIGIPLDRAAVFAASSCLAVGCAGLVWAHLDRRVEVGAGTRRAAGIVVALVCAAGLAAAGAKAATSIDDPAAWASARWHDFTRGYQLGPGRSRFTRSLGDDRLEIWKVAWHEFADHPTTGIGADNFAAAYLARRAHEYYEPRYPHSTPLRLLSQLGLVGAGLFALAAGIAVVLALRRRRRLDPGAGGALGAALTVFGYWLLHGSIDWLWEFPALAGIAFALLGLAAAPSPARDEPPRRPRAGLGLLPLAACGVLLFPWLSLAYEEAGARVWKRDPGLAYARLERAASLDPLDGEPLLVEGSIALRRGDRARAREALGRALRREPRNWYASLQLALLAGSERRYDEAARRARRALELNPRDPVARGVAALARRRRPVDPQRLNRRYLEELDRRLQTNVFLSAPPALAGGSQDTSVWGTGGVAGRIQAEVQSGLPRRGAPDPLLRAVLELAALGLGAFLVGAALRRGQRGVRSGS